MSEEIKNRIAAVKENLPKVDLPLENRELPDLRVKKPIEGVSEKTLVELSKLSDASGTPDKEEEKEPEEDEVFFSEREKELKRMREATEKDLEPMRFEDLITGPRELRQLVPVREGFSVLFRTVSVEEDLYVKKTIAKMGNSSTRVYYDSYVLYTLICSVESINGEVMPSHLTSKKDIDPEGFDKRSIRICSYSNQIVELLSNNYVWFSNRVQKLISEPELKNG